ncbi:MAG: hypothetical protein J3K34DRAFT_433512 [Monoraphidium minutum]|nr:MAG: hypothetical protein J3K34DRAFT_433512 [Monoraphidium minutum]
MAWLNRLGAKQDKVTLRTLEVAAAGRPLDVTVAAAPLAAGAVALSVPDELVVTVDRIVQSETLAEMLTAGKLSELAVLTLYLMYEKKIKKESEWYHFIKELDRQRARGVQAVESPLLWSPEELEELLEGSPVVPAVQQRLEGMRKEYEALDGVWFMAGSLFNKYPFDIPTEAFPFERFRQAFAAVQASVVHLQGVAQARRFALVPLGPPLLSYSSTCKAMLSHNDAAKRVELVVDRNYEIGEPIYAWCGPQPNSRLLINYGIVDESNPFDKLQLTVTLPSSDPLFKAKRDILDRAGLSTMQTFDMKRSEPLPPLLLPYLRLAFSTSQSQLGAVRLEAGAGPIDAEIEQQAGCALAAYLDKRLAAYRRPLWRDLEILEDPASTPRQKVAARLTKIEKGILQGCLDAVKTQSPCSTGAAGGSAAAPLAIKLA